MAQARNVSLQKQLNPTILGADSTAPSGGMAYKTIGYGKAASKGNWNAFASPDDMALKAFEQQSIPEKVGDTVIGAAKRFGAGFLDSIGAWDVSNMTAMAMDKTNVDYSNWFNRLGAKITKDANEENQIYQDPNGSIWNGAYLANQVQQLGLKQSMSRRGNCWDNAPQESFFGHFKDEVILSKCSTLEEVIKEIDDYMDYYNNYRYQWNLSKMTPVQYRNHLVS